ncbi:unnamed protein product [Brassicogethes aeneus]|uniref:CCHC-type domain-containing protein n=1 Tax=Brassicogethes aeneus TaxID=1431903 RepID=A0A9P0BF68_BRAAE|nr:unnamed protein product [Brassicogethes aeneus]
MLTGQGIGTPEPVGNGGGSAGPTRSSTNDCTAPGANQPGCSATATGIPLRSDGTLTRMFSKMSEAVKDGTRRGSLTTPGSPNVSTELVRCNSLNTDKKRKNTDTSFSSVEAYKIKESSEVFVIIEALGEITRIGKTLEQHMEQNTKREVREACVRLSRQVEIINRRIVQNWLENHRFERVEKMLIDVDTQTENKVESEKEKISIEKIDSFDDYAAVTEEKWKDYSYSQTSVMVGNPVATKDSTTKVVFVEKSDPNMDKGIQKLFKERCPELLSENKFDVVEQRIYTRTGGTEKESRKKIIKAWHNGTEEDLWNNLLKIKEETKDDSEVAVHTLKSVRTEALRRMIECIFHGRNTRFEIYRQKEDSKGGEGKSLTYALVLENAGKTYEDTMKEVKEAVGSNPAKNIIRNIRSTREGKMIITMDRDKGAMEELQKAIKLKTEMRVRAPGQKRKEIIRGIEGTAGKDEVETAIKDTVKSLGDKEWNLSELRPSYGNNQTATVTADREVIKALADAGHIRVGMVRCEVVKRVELTRCYKCWAYDHRAADCKGPDRSKLCHKCGREGHKIRDCPNKEACLLCSKEHQTGSSKCPAFNKAIRSAREAEKIKTAEPQRS